MTAGMGVGFFLPADTGMIGVLVKGILFVSLFAAISLFFWSPGHSRLTKTEDHPEKKGFEETPEPVHSENGWAGFGKAFTNYTHDFLGVIRSAIVASVSGFYLKKSDDSVELQAADTESGHFDQRQKVREGDLVERIVREKRPMLEGNLPFGLHMAGLPGAEIRSFLGVPIGIKDEVVGVLAVGSEATESFGSEDQALLTRCASLLTHVMTLCHRGIHDETNQEVFSVHLDLQKELAASTGEENAVALFVSRIRKIFPFERFTFCVKHGEDGMIHSVFGQIDDMEQNQVFPLDAGLTGLVIRRNTPILIDDLQEGNFARPRYFKGENAKHGLRSFLGIPLNRGGEESWGCISIECKKPGQYSSKGKDVLSGLVILLENTLERLQLRDEVQASQNRGNSQSEIHTGNP